MTKQSPWRFEPLRAYETPDMPAAESVRDRLMTAWRQLFARPSKEDAKQREFGRLSREHVANIIPEHDWNAGVAALQRCFEEVLPTDGSQRTAVVGPPGSGVQPILSAWAESCDAECLTPPKRGECLTQESGEKETTLDGRLEVPEDDDGRPLAIVDLAQWYLRHPAGLRVVRELLQQLRTLRRPVVVGCDSWAWAYLSKAIHVDALLPNAYALAALCGPTLRAWLAELCGGDDACPREFRFADDDSRLVLTADESTKDADSAEHRGFLDRLASTSRGIPEVALALWEHCLRTVKDDSPSDQTSEKDQDSRGEADEVATTVDPPTGQITWIQSKALSDLPLVPSDLTRSDAIVLHTLLIHAGLSEELLSELLPFDASQISRSLLLLGNLDVVCQRENTWTVQPLAYPNVRRFLKHERFLVDSF